MILPKECYKTLLNKKINTTIQCVQTSFTLNLIEFILKTLIHIKNVHISNKTFEVFLIFFYKSKN